MHGRVMQLLRPWLFAELFPWRVSNYGQTLIHLASLYTQSQMINSLQWYLPCDHLSLRICDHFFSLCDYLSVLLVFICVCLCTLGVYICVSL